VIYKEDVIAIITAAGGYKLFLSNIVDRGKINILKCCVNVITNYALTTTLLLHCWWRAVCLSKK